VNFFFIYNILIIFYSKRNNKFSFSSKYLLIYLNVTYLLLIFYDTFYSYLIDLSAKLLAVELYLIYYVTGLRKLWFWFYLYSYFVLSNVVNLN